MIKVQFSVPLQDAKWQDWVRRVRAARQKMRRSMEEGREWSISDTLYKEQRQRFLEAFSGKCAYCELMLAEGQRDGDVEHFRPKGRVTNEEGKLVFSPMRKHCGYYWLAYSWRNLLPACLACNRPGTGPDGKLTGKWDRFPTDDDFWSEAAKGIRQEKPLLLNPWIDHPQDHLYFDDTGVVGFKTKRGEVTIRVLGLNRDKLVDARREASKLAARDVRSLNEAYARGDAAEASEYEERINTFLSGKVAYSAASSAAAMRASERHEAARRNNPFRQVAGD